MQEQDAFCSLQSCNDWRALENQLPLASTRWQSASNNACGDEDAKADVQIRLALVTPSPRTPQEQRIP